MKRLKSIVMAALAVVIAAASALPTLPVEAVSSSALNFTPKKNYVIEPGKSVKDKLKLSNLDHSNPLQLTLHVIDFSYTDDTGTPKLFLDQNAPQTTWSLKPYMSVPESVTIPAGGTKTLDMSVAMPAGLGAGSYYSAILYSTGAPNGGNVGLSASGVTLVFVNVPGKVKENLTLQKFGAYRQATASKPAGYEFIATTKPQTIAYTLKNAGNVVESPVGSITLSGMFGQKITIDNVNPAGSLALIGQSRTFTTCIKLKSQDVNFQGSKTEAAACADPTLWPGMYTAKLDLFYGQNGNITQEVVGTTVFWYLPWWFIILATVVLLVLAYVIWRLYNKIRGRQHAHSRKRR